MATPHVVQLTELPTLPCPCGRTQRAFAQPGQFAASVHLVEIHEDARAHYHRRMTEVYVVLDGNGAIELDGRAFPVRPLTAIYLPPGCRHRALGKLRVLNIAIPAFDPSDEWFDEPPPA
jgi:mannose-6-phosphate isomerase-like protein (cupin superfamily)